MHMKGLYFLLLFFTFCNLLHGQEEIESRDTTHILEEVSVKAVVKRKVETELKMAVSVDEYLASSEHISFIKRGAYAWEPLLNNMGMERSSITIDGMHVFGACTDKMDPITAYVESNNLASIDIVSGQHGGSYGATIAGSIDLKRRRSPFSMGKTWNGAYQTGFEFNNKQLLNMANLSYSSDRFVFDGSLALRNASNYYDGRRKEINNSQYNKFNSSLGLAYKTGELSSLRLDAIFDKATNVGYPALPMDLLLSRAIIASVAYKQLFQEKWMQAWDTKMYFNSIEHYMDDTKRPENLVHMDMPGWSTTYGLTSRIDLKKENYNADLRLNAYNNTSIAEMTMYPQDRSHTTMFAYTWPWITTRFAGLSINNSWNMSERSALNFGGALGWQYNNSRFAEFNWVFYPGAPQSKNRVLPSFHAGYQFDLDRFEFSVGMGYGQRAPSVSEAYGYYIYNSFDRYDYIGNPNLKNEVSYEWNTAARYKKEKWGIEGKLNYFYIQNYIVGRILNVGSPMNYQSVGVKGYASLAYVNLLNMSVKLNYDFLSNLHWKGALQYAKAVDDNKQNLPFIRPLNFHSSLHYEYKQFGIIGAFHGDFKHRDYSPEYGEEQTSGFGLVDLSMDYSFRVKKYKIVVQGGIENLFDKYYVTYADWGKTPRMGRNIFTSLKVSF